MKTLAIYSMLILAGILTVVGCGPKAVDDTESLKKQGITLAPMDQIVKQKQEQPPKDTD